MSLTLDQLLAAIRHEESGSYAGNYSARNPGGAAGAYQIMPSNIPEWSREALGHSISLATFMASPALQDQIARFILGRDFNKYGAAGAAAMWFSGQPNPNSLASDGNTTVKAYVAKVLNYGANYASGGTGGGGGVGGTGAGGTPVVTPKLDPKTLAAMYGLSTSLINSDKSLKAIFSQAVAQQWTPDVFVAHLKNTTWWSTQSDTMRQYLTLKYTDPATFSQRVTATAYKVNQLAVAVGYGNMLGDSTSLGKMNPILQQAVMKVMQSGWTDQQITNWLGGALKFNGGQLGGQAGQDYDKLQAYAYANGLNMSASWYQDQIHAIEGGRTDTEAVLAGLRSQAAAKYSAYSAQIMAGQDAMSLAAPFTHAVAQLLELPETSVDLSNKYVAKAMTTPVGKDGDPAGSQYSLWQLENDVRADPMWRKTDNARESVAQTALQIGRDFGMSI